MTSVPSWGLWFFKSVSMQLGAIWSSCEKTNISTAGSKPWVCEIYIWWIDEGRPLWLSISAAPCLVILLNYIYMLSLQISHCCMMNELQRFPFLRKRVDEVIGNFLRESLEPSEKMIENIIEMEVCRNQFINDRRQYPYMLQSIKLQWIFNDPNLQSINAKYITPYLY